MIKGRAILLAGVGLLLAAGAQAVPLTVLNPSFEFPPHPLPVSCGSDCSYTLGFVTDWTVTGGAGVFHPTSFYFSFPLPSGDQTAYSNGGSISQVLTSTLQNSTTYSLTVAVGKRKDVGLPGYSVSLYAGSTLLATDSALDPAAGAFALSTVSYASGASDPLTGQSLRIVLASTGAQANFDDVRLDASSVGTPIPEPATLLLLGPGLVGVFRHAWRARRRPTRRGSGSAGGTAR